jgi:hypothetical protein
VSNEELAKRIVERMYPGGASLRLERPPARYEIPVPKDAEVIGTLIQGPDDDPDQVTVYFDVAADAPAIISGVESDLAARGYSRALPPSAPRTGIGGFRHTMGMGVAGNAASFVAGEDVPFYTVNVRGTDRVKDVMVSWNSGLRWHPARQQRRGPPMPPGAEAIPELEGPPGVQVQGGGGGGSEDFWYSQGSATTDMTARILLDHFAQQLERAGCTAIARGGSDDATWGRWQVSSDLETIVAVFAPLPMKRFLLQYTFSPKRLERRERMMSSWSSGISFSGRG